MRRLDKPRRANELTAILGAGEQLVTVVHSRAPTVSDAMWARKQRLCVARPRHRDIRNL